MSTSGLSIAMSEESLRSLKFCLNWLKWANDHIGRVIGALKDTLEKYEHSGDESADQSATDRDHAMSELSNGNAHGQGELAAKITVLKADVLKTLQSVIETVSKYTGGALPDNARELVRRHLTSLPQRFKLARQMDSPQQQGETTPREKEQEVKEGAQRVLVLAKEGLDMMSQVSGVLDGTIVSAEEWCERLGKKKRDERHALLNPQTAPLTSVGVDNDARMVE
ncbi:putative clock controlled protein [Phaeoacremonium minimum UCRPA7]|uniref:Putative clock controlled protein n=1 Tax=Phaeoacremonium minimum (strain UCR-PA7) TaxID=1286976 RepID=R8BLG0_PHAM7|nr:putative clock controlled protein [Phaeoacremonium minimum UCRPA7]EOO00198.1 putative clock controlled protein [Phaeoacremonium minimum UCRPA7]